MQESNVDEHLNEETMKEIPTVYTIHGIKDYKCKSCSKCFYSFKGSHSHSS